MAEFAASVEWGRAPTTELGEPELTRAFRRPATNRGVARAPGAVFTATGIRAPTDRAGVDLLVDSVAEVGVVVDGDIDLDPAARKQLQVAPDVGGATLLTHAYKAWNEHFPMVLRGEFSGVIWDWRRQKVICFRDPIGLRPLFYSTRERGVVIASEVEVVLGAVGRQASIDDQMVIEHLSWNYQSTDRTFWSHVSRLHGGHLVVVQPRRSEVRRYWSLPRTRAEPGSITAVHDEFRDLFLRALRRSMTGDVPMLAHLSGGVDSSMIVCAADRLRRESSAPRAPIKVVSARYPGLGCDESSYIDAVIRSIKFPSDSWDGRQSDFRELDTPSVAGPAWWVHRADGSTGEFDIAARTGARYIISGLGGDHVGAAFGAIEDRVRQKPVSFAWTTLERSDLTTAQRLRRLRILVRTFLPSPIRSRVAAMRGQRRAPRWLHTRWRALAGRLVAGDLPRTDGAFTSSIQEARWRELTGARLGLCLDAEHRVSSAHDVEMRYPFLDRDLVEFALSLPRESWPSSANHYRLHREALGDLLPDEIRPRTTKARFSYVIAHRVTQARERIKRLLYAGEWASERWIDRSRAQLVFEELMSRAVPETDLLAWQGILATAQLEAWLRTVFGYASGGHA